ncbi:hypothetical protein DFH06DRAFT_1182866, partial [Mycena polygramma]
SNAFHVFSGRAGALSGLSCGRATFSRAACRPSRQIPPLRFPTATRVSVTAAAFSYSHAVAEDPISVEDAVDAVSESSTSLPALERPSKISFAAAQAVRMCIRNGGIADGFFVLNSLRYSAYRHKSSALPFRMPGMAHSRTEFEAAALQFGPDVSPRLTAHALLHGLIRNNLAEPAFELAKMIMAEGVALRSATMEAIIEALVSSGAPRRRVARGLPFAGPNPTIPLKLASDVLVLRPSAMADRRTRFALQLLFLARRHRQRRTDTMFKLFMAASLLNGELIIFSLLFGWTCRDWQNAHALESTLEVIPGDDELQYSTQVIAARRRLTHLRNEAIFPDKHSLESALTVIDTILMRDGESKPTHDRLVALQALGNLAGLLERRQIPFPDIASLLRTMYKCPRVEDEIWIVGRTHTSTALLSNLIESLPNHQPLLRRPPAPPNALAKNRRYDMLPPLELSGYNTLLHYALRHRLSPALGDARWEPISPDIVTANILVRSGTLMRRYDIVADVLMSKLTYAAGIEPEISISLDPLRRPVQDRTDIVVNHTRWGQKLGRMASESIETPANLPSEADIYTLTAYISYLTSRGHPRTVKKLLFRLFPELDTAKYPTNSELEEDHILGRTALLTSLRRAITLGPVFLSSVLNALYKSGQAALADRVWQLAQKAERRSWVRDLVPECKPWIFHPHVYTVMMNCYGDLARRQRPWRFNLPPDKRVSERTARSSVWARFLYECQKMPSPLPNYEVQLLLRRMMSHAALNVFRRLVNLKREHERNLNLRSWLAKKDIPKPDARFFNAALHVFRPRSPPMRRSWHRRQLRDALHGVLPANNHWNPPLHEIAETMINAGHGIPHGLRHLFVGRLDSIHLPILRPPDRGPFAYRVYRYHPWLRYRLPTPKEKGLPVSRQYPQFLGVLAQRRRQIRMRKRKRRKERRGASEAKLSN